MLSLSDANELAQSIYTPTAIAILTLIAVGSFLNVGRLFDDLFNSFAKGFGFKFEGVDNSGTEPKTGIARVSLIVFTLFAWPAFFYNIGNLFPVTLIYSPEQFYLPGGEQLAEIACARISILDPKDVADLVDVTAFPADSAKGAAIEGQIDRALHLIGIARSLLLITVMSFFAYALLPRFRKLKPALLVLLLVVIAYVSWAGYRSVGVAMEYEARTKTAAVRAALPDEAVAKITPECAEEFASRAARRADRSAVWIELDWPNVEALIPRR